MTDLHQTIAGPISESAPEFESGYMRYKQEVEEDLWSLRLITGEGVLEHENGDVDLWRDSLTKAAIDLHDGVGRHDVMRNELPDTHQPPAVIFVTATRAIPFGFALQSFWRGAYPEEPVPAFKIIDSSRKRFTQYTPIEVYDMVEGQEVARLKKAGEQYGFDDAAVFDEMRMSGLTLRQASRLLERAGFTNTNFVGASVGEVIPDMLPDRELPLVRQDWSDGKLGLREFRRLLWNAGPESRALIKDMKKIGQLMVVEARRRGAIK